MSNANCTNDNNLHIQLDGEVDIVGIKGLRIPEELRRQWFGESQPKPPSDIESAS